VDTYVVVISGRLLFNKLKYFRRIATRYDKLGSTFLAMTKLACIRLRLRHYESTA
jgi:transposase